MNHESEAAGVWDTASRKELAISARRVHYALTGLYVAVVIVLQFLLFLRTFHIVFIMLVSSGFTYVLAGLYIGIMASNVDHLSGFAIGYGQARVIVWTSVVALIFVILTLLQILFLINLPPLSAEQASVAQQPMVLSNTSVETVELVLSHHIHTADRFALFVTALLFILIAILHLVSIVVNVRIILAIAPTASPTVHQIRPSGSSVIDMESSADAYHQSSQYPQHHQPVQQPLYLLSASSPSPPFNSPLREKPGSGYGNNIASHDTEPRHNGNGVRYNGNNAMHKGNSSPTYGKLGHTSTRK